MEKVSSAIEQADNWLGWLWKISQNGPCYYFKPKDTGKSEPN